MVQNDVATINRLLADDYLGINPNGTLETKADALAQRRSGTMKVSSIEPDQPEGPGLWRHGRGDVAGRCAGHGRRPRHQRPISLHARLQPARSGEWKIVSFEASRIPSGSKH